MGITIGEKRVYKELLSCIGGRIAPTEYRDIVDAVSTLESPGEGICVSGLTKTQLKYRIDKAQRAGDLPKNRKYAVVESDEGTVVLLVK